MKQSPIKQVSRLPCKEKRGDEDGIQRFYCK